MRLYARERCADPRAYYDTVEDVMSDDDLTADEKEYILKSMAVDAELLDADGTDKGAPGEQASDIAAIHKALNHLGDAYSFEDNNVSAVNESEKELMPFTRIVAAIVGNDDLDSEVVRNAETIARLSGGEAIFVSVVEPEPDPSTIGAASSIGGVIVAAPETRAARDTRVRARERRASEELSERVSRGLNYKIEVRTGLIGDEVLRVAKEHAADLIVIGSHDRSWIEGLFSSDTAHQVASCSACPVLIVPENVESRF